MLRQKMYLLFFRCRPRLGLRVRPLRAARQRREQEADKPNPDRLQTDVTLRGHRRQDVHHRRRVLPQLGCQRGRIKALHVGM